MALTVEDGTGLTGADAFISLAYYKAWADDRGHSYSAYSDAELEQAIVRATDYLSESFHWQGYKLKERGASGGTQALAWPRTYVVDRNGYSVANDEVPVEVMKATAEIAKAEAATPGIMQPTYTPHDRVKSERFGSVAFEYDLGSRDAQGARPVLLAVRDLIGQFLAATGSSIVGETLRT